MPFDSTTFTDDPVITLLTKARRHVEAGWCQCNLYGSGGSVCSLGGLAMVDKQHIGVFTCDSMSKAIRKLDAAAIEHGYTNIVQMNDAPGMTKERILAVFDEALDA